MSSRESKLQFDNLPLLPFSIPSEESDFEDITESRVTWGGISYTPRGSGLCLIDNAENSLKFFKDLKIQNLGIYFDSPVTLAKKFGLRGIPTTILFNKEGLEFARIVGSIDFEDKKFIDWLSNYN